MKTKTIRRLTYSALLIALGYVLPFITGQIPEIGTMLSPLHIPALLSGFIIGPLWGTIVSIIIPITRGPLFGMPPIYPTGIAMAFECATYALICGLMNKFFKKNIPMIYVAQIIAMIVGRIIYALVIALIASGKMNDGFILYAASLFTREVPGIILHLAIVPPIVIALRKAKMTCV